MRVFISLWKQNIFKIYIKMLLHVSVFATIIRELAQESVWTLGPVSVGTEKNHSLQDSIPGPSIQ
jgi:hypothetical protein